VPCCRRSQQAASKKNLLSWRSYTQGQLTEGGERQYFYYIDHQGMLYLDDARMKNFTSCFKEKKFLKFFFKRVKRNRRSLCDEWPHVSPCGDEMNYIRCDDTPVVFQSLLGDSSKPLMSWGDESGILTQPFSPEDVAICPRSGRVYHPAAERQGGVGLIKSKVAIWLSNSFVFEGEGDQPSHIMWHGDKIKLNHEVLELLEEMPSLGRYSEECL